MQSATGGLSKRGRDAGRLKAVQGGLETQVVADRYPTAQEREDLPGGGRKPGGRSKPTVTRLYELAGGPNQHISVPDGREPVLDSALDTHANLTAPKVDSVNSFEKPNTVTPKPISAKAQNGKLSLDLEPRSVTVVAVE